MPEYLAESGGVDNPLSVALSR